MINWADSKRSKDQFKMKTDKSEWIYQVIFGLYLVALIASEFMYVVFWVGMVVGIWAIVFTVTWLWRFEWLKWMEKKDKL